MVFIIFLQYLMILSLPLLILLLDSLLTADDIKRLRSSGFPDAACPPARLDWGPWKVAWPRPLVDKIEAIVSQPATSHQSGAGGPPRDREISFNRYQEMAGNVVRGTTEERIKLLFYLIHQSTSGMATSNLNLLHSFFPAPTKSSGLNCDLLMSC